MQINKVKFYYELCVALCTPKSSEANCMFTFSFPFSSRNLSSFGVRTKSHTIRAVVTTCTGQWVDCISGNEKFLLARMPRGFSHNFFVKKVTRLLQLVYLSTWQGRLNFLFSSSSNQPGVPA